MEIFDSLTLKAKGLLSSFAARPLPFPVSWPIPSCDPMLFKSDTAFELGCDRHSGISSLFVTSTEGLIPNDSLLLVGDPIQSLHQNGSYAKMVFVEVDESKLGDTKEALFQNLRRVDAIRYRVRAEGVMTRISPLEKKETLRIGKEALKKGFDFDAYGSLLLNAYREMPLIKKASVVFVTDPSFPFEELRAINEQVDERTKALDHLLRDVKMDCHVCKLQPVCKDVEEAMKTDFAKEKNQ